MQQDRESSHSEHGRETHSQPKGFTDIWQDNTSSNPNNHIISIRMNLPKQIYNHANQITTYKKERLRTLESRESSPEWIQIKEKSQAYRKLDDRMKDDERKKNSQLYRAYADAQTLILQRDKANFSLFESFEDRGKYPQIRFTYKKKQNYKFFRYFFQQLKLTRTDILILPTSFVSIWQNDLREMIRIIYRLSFENDKPHFYNMIIRSIDLISITFDIQYGDKRIYRFRYSPFQFRSALFLKDQILLQGYHQFISIIPDITSLKTAISDSDFYTAPRCFIFQDLIDFNLAVKILQKTNIFYIAYSISRGITNFYSNPSFQQTDQYSKKCLWYLYFSTTRLKKFIYTWSFKPFRKNTQRQQYTIKDIELPSKEIIFHTPFYIDVRDKEVLSKDDPFYRIRVQYHEPTREMANYVKQEIVYRTRQWYTHFREIMSSRDPNRERHMNEQEKIPPYQKRDRERAREGDRQKDQEKPDRQEGQLEMLFGNRDRFDRFLMGFLVLVSTVIDRNYFTMTDERCLKTMDQTKLVILETPETVFRNEKHQHLLNYHWLQIHLEHKILPYQFQYKQEKNRFSVLGLYPNFKPHQIRLKCGEWRLSRLYKCKRQWNLKLKKGTIDSKGLQVLHLPQKFREYVDILLRHFPLRFIYKDIINFVAGIGKICYNGWEETNTLDLSKNQPILRPIISAILSLYYFAPLEAFKQKQQKIRGNMFGQQAHHQKQLLQPQQKALQEQKAKRDDRLADQFSRVVVIKILTKGDIGFMAEQKLMAEVTFRLMEFKSCWITRVKEGVIMIRVFEDRVKFEKQYEVVEEMRYGPKNKSVGLEEQSVRERLQKIPLDLRHPIIL